MFLFDHDWSSLLKDASTLALYLAASTAVKLSVWWTACSPSMVPRCAVRVGHVTALKLYPVKSMGGLGLSDAECTSTGLKMSGVELRDRQWIVTIGEMNRFVTARQKPQLLTVRLEVDLAGQQLNISAPNMDNVLRLPLAPDVSSLQSTLFQTKLWSKPICGYDCGVEAGQWLDKFLGEQGHRLLFSPADISGKGVRNMELLQEYYSNPVKPTDKLVYQDVSTFSIASSTTLDDLNGRLDDVSKRRVTMENFRPTITIDATTEAYDEDEWNELFIGNDRNGYVSLRMMSIAPRCRIINIDPATGCVDKDGEPYKTLGSYRKIVPLFDGPCFGSFLFCDRTGSIRVGDSVFALKRRGAEETTVAKRTGNVDMLPNAFNESMWDALNEL